MKIRRQKGMSLVGFLLLLSMVVFCVYLGMRIVPIYIEYYSVRQAMEGIANEPGSSTFSPFTIKNKMMNRLWISYTNQNVGVENIKVTRNKGVWLQVKYEVREPIIGNLDVIASFDDKVQLSN